MKPVVSVAVRELTDFVLRRGDLGGSRDFVAPDRALAGTRAHQRWQQSRPAGYRKEVAVQYDVDGVELVVRVQGRIDGVLVSEGGVAIEELKTVQAGWDRVADPLHWAQLRIYGFLYSNSAGLKAVDLRLIHINLDSGEVTEACEGATDAELADFFHKTVAVYLDWIRDLHLWRQTRNESIRSGNFPFPRHRAGQRHIAVAAYRTMARGGRLFVEAPTGIGKTAAVLFPALKTLGEERLERVYYLTARTAGRAVAEQALCELRAAGMRLRSLTLTAREKLCVQNGQPCDPTTCPLAIGYYDRRHAAMRELLQRESITRAVIEIVGRERQVCPFELGLDVSTWVDVVIGDYNHLFDPTACLRRHFTDDPGAYGFLVDEAHNLVDRAREMFSAELSTQGIRDISRRCRPAAPRCASALTRVDAALRELARSFGARPDRETSREEQPQLDLFSRLSIEPKAVAGPELIRPGSTVDERADGIRTSRELPAGLLAPLDAAMAELESWLARNCATPFRDELIELYRRLRGFRLTADLYDERYATILATTGPIRVRLFCVDPSFLLRRALDRGRSTIFFSATLTPVEYYRELLGGSPADPVVRVPSPFDPGRLAVFVHDSVRTQWKDRARSLTDIVEDIGAVIEAQPGNYLVYLPSYDYLNAVRAGFEAAYPLVTIRVQEPGMSESDRDAFLASFGAGHGGTQVGFAVMGGVFGEAIDLVGDRLIGAMIVGVGLPQLCVERDLIREYFDAHAGCGFDYAYTFPGMNRVVQATGRVIRSELDRGTVLLIDARFGEGRYRRLFPAGWQPVRVTNAAGIRAAVRGFWDQES